jgi:hypothetical protein
MTDWMFPDVVLLRERSSETVTDDVEYRRTLPATMSGITDVVEFTGKVYVG